MSHERDLGHAATRRLPPDGRTMERRPTSRPTSAAGEPSGLRYLLVGTIAGMPLLWAPWVPPPRRGCQQVGGARSPFLLRPFLLLHCLTWRPTPIPIRHCLALGGQALSEGCIQLTLLGNPEPFCFVQNLVWICLFPAIPKEASPLQDF